MVFTGAEITAWVGSFVWPLFRVGALVMAAPIFSAATVPVKIRAGLALVLRAVKDGLTRNLGKRQDLCG